MINLIPTSDYTQDIASQHVWKWLEEQFKGEEGFCYYKDTLIASNTGSLPELVFYSRSHQPIIFRCLSCTIDEIDEILEDEWIIKGESFDSPILELDDFQVKLKSKFDQDRLLRQKLIPMAVLALPLINRSDFIKKFGDIFENAPILWIGPDNSVFLIPLDQPLNDIEWKVLRSIAQGIKPLRTGLSGRLLSKKQTLGEAIKELEKQIALLDTDQEKAAKQIAPGIQRIRGLAGTGKTVLLAMRAVEIHRQFPNKKILFTFNTQSLYNQARKLITQFYRFRVDEDPDWDLLHLRHAWGGRNRPGVYYDLCGRQGVIPLNFNDVRGAKSPFQMVCKAALANPILPEYDFILVDEAQDFPNEFFQVLLKLSFPPHCVCYAYDELQSLYSLEIPNTEDMFGFDRNGNPYVVFDGEDYPGEIEKEFVLHQSYRCPQPVLMLAHAIGLGLYSSHGCVQMLENEESWKSIGYEIERGKLVKGELVEIYRSPENSPNRIAEVYAGNQDTIVTRRFSDRGEELEWIANSIMDDIKVQKVTPEQIIVISLDSRLAKDYMAKLQMNLVQRGIASTIPGLIDDTASFMETGKVTLSTIHRAKGNESPIVYILSFDSLYDYLASIENRNRAFTSISRSKAWVRITGVGRNMQQAQEEIAKIQTDYPRFRFIFPDMESIRRLDAETVKRQKQVSKGVASVTSLLNLDPQALAAVAQTNPKLIAELLKRIEGANLEHQ